MGQAMAANVLKSGYDLTVWNRNKDKGKELVEQGAQWAESPAAAAREADFVIAMLSDDNAVEQVAFREQGVLTAMQPGKIFINMSTTSVKLAHDLANFGRECGVRTLDAPVVGSVKPAQDASLMILISGDQDAYQDSEPLIHTMGQTLHYMGSTGNALFMKLIFNGLLATQLAAFAELVAMGNKAGLDRTQVIELLCSGSLASPALKMRAENVLKNEHTAAFTLRLMHKDMGLVTESGRDLGVAMPVAAATTELYAIAANLDLKEEDISLIVPIVERLAGLD
jgi:3-hydroxyisobutyrate dehydrogenase-like beta-hydroxyacid dehydrogenase